jgi:hypothetical protein
MDVLDAAVGHGDLESHVVIDQIYAHYQHEDLLLNHPRGGNAEYLRRALLTHQDEYMQHVADLLLTVDGSDIIKGASEVAEQLASDAAEQTPREFEDLMRSGHPFVLDDGVTVYDRAPEVHRLTDEELDEKSRERDKLGLGRRHSAPIPEHIKAELRARREARRRRT